MNWKEKLFAGFKLYAVTDLTSGDESILEKIENAYRGGVDIVQLRGKNLTDNELYRIGLKIRALANQYQKLFFVNDRLDLALSVSADGVHIGQDDLPVREMRRLMSLAGTRMWVGKSTHSPEQAIATEAEDVDYLGVGPVFQTPTKPAYQAVGLEYVQYAAEHLHKPFVAIGGIDAGNIQQVLAAGAKRVAVVRAIFNTRDSYENTRKIREKIDQFQQKN